MGASLTSPVELIRVQRHGGSAFRVGAAEMQGWRGSHEDAHEVACDSDLGHFWVLDGHGGDGAALLGAPRLGKEFAEFTAQGEMPEDSRIEDGLIAVDKSLRGKDDSGATVTGAFARRDADGTYTVKLVNAGDSRGIIVRSHTEQASSAKSKLQRTPAHLKELAKDPEMIRKGNAPGECVFPLMQESIDHKPSHPTEKKRIVAAGGHVTDDDPPRLDGNLAVSRGFADFEYKMDPAKHAGDQKVSCVPDIYETKGLAAGSLVVLCCDGVYDVYTSSEVAELVHEMVVADPDVDLGEIATKIIRGSLERDSRDNITAMVVQLAPGKKWAESHPPDELKGFEKLIKENDEQVTDDGVRDKYNSILKKWQFPSEPIFCDVCAQWNERMMLCPCRKVYYCNKECQKKGWKHHKPICLPVANK